jgi:hypothetical protein
LAEPKKHRDVHCPAVLSTCIAWKVLIMSRFVSGGTVDKPTERDDEWLKAQETIEAARRKKEDEARQHGGKSLYEVLQANKGV